MTLRQNINLGGSFVMTLMCGTFEVLAYSAGASHAAVGWAVAALAFGATFKVLSKDYGVWG